MNHNYHITYGGYKKFADRQEKKDYKINTNKSLQYRVVIIIPVLWNVQMEYAEESSQLRNVII